MSTKNQQYFEEYLDREMGLGDASFVVKTAPEVIDIEDYNMLKEKRIKVGQMFQFKMNLLIRSNEEVMLKFIEMHDIGYDDLSFYMFMNGYTLNDLIRLTTEHDYVKRMMSYVREYQLVFMLNQPEFVNTLNKDIVDYMLNEFEYFVSQRHGLWDKTEDKYLNPLSHLPYFNDYNETVQRQIKKRIMELKFSRGSKSQSSMLNTTIKNMHGMFSGCSSIPSYKFPKIKQNLPLTDKGDDNE